MAVKFKTILTLKNAINEHANAQMKATVANHQADLTRQKVLEACEKAKEEGVPIQTIERMFDDKIKDMIEKGVLK